MLEDLNQKTLATGFWNDNEAAQKVLRKRSQVEQKLDLAKNLAKDLGDLAEYLELGAAENDEGVIADAHAQARAIEARLRKAELERMLSGPADKANAILSIHPGAGGTDAKDWAQMLLRMYMRWAERRGFKTDMLDYEEGEEAGISAASISIASFA
jgi:peptide chain release factor 2